jgi:polar amino acid transport system substrate-binding protein
VQAQTIVLSPEEKKVINRYHLQCISTGLWAPFNLIEKDQLTGIGFDYWKLIQERLGIKSRCIKAKSWVEVLESIRQKKADLTIASQETEERLKYAVFSKPYVTYPMVIATKNSVGFIHDITLIKDKKIVMPKSYATTNILIKHYPELKIEYTVSIDKALEMVERGKAYATLDILPVIAYKINKDGFDTLKISGSIPESFKVGIMLRRDYQALIPLIDRAIDSISQEEKRQINEKWITIHREEKIPRKYFYILMAWTLFVIIFFSWWLFSLKREISKKNKIEKKLQKLVGIDSLTKISNRYMLDKRLDREVSLFNRYHIPLSIIFFDINGFKLINDEYGHKTGDIILQELSKLVEQNIRQSDLFGRWGGDEFLIILPSTTLKSAQKLADILSKKIQEYTFTKDICLCCTFGVATCQKGDSRINMIKRADKCFYNKKKAKLNAGA